MSFEEHQAKDRRLQLLMALASDSDYEINHYVLLGLLADIGHRISQDKLLADLAWLVEMGLITTETLPGGMLVAKITGRGLDVASGATVIPGIRKPRPDEV